MRTLGVSEILVVLLALFFEHVPKIDRRRGRVGVHQRLVVSGVPLDMLAWAQQCYAECVRDRTLLRRLIFVAPTRVNLGRVVNRRANVDVVVLWIFKWRSCVR